MPFMVEGISSARPGVAGGPGYIAGESPNGLVLLEGVPVSRRIMAMHRASGVIVASTYSNPDDGTYLLDGLNPDQEFDVIMHEVTRENRDQIKGRVRPKPY